MVPRGIRNNNPGNVERGRDKWKGMADEQTDPRFIEFDFMEYGVRAIVRILRSYNRRGVSTIEEIVETWAPSVENDTKAYISTMEKVSGLAKTDKINFQDGDELMGVVKGIIIQENGQRWLPKDAVIKRGIELA
jgi:hypothetical protein